MPRYAKDTLNELMKDPEFRKEWESMEPEFQIIKRAGVAPLVYESSKYQAKHTAITKSGSKYLRKTLYQIILPVIRYNPVFQKYYDLKISQGKSHRCACGHCVRKLLRIIFHLLKTNQKFDPALLR